MNRLAIHYCRQFFGETTSVVAANSARTGAPRGLVGRQVANAEMLAALLRHGSDELITFLVDNDGDVQSLKSTLRQLLPANKKVVVSKRRNLDQWMAQPHRRVIWEPQPPTAMLAWTRSRLARSRIALGGVTHALCSSMAVSAMRELVVSPLRHFDRLVCTSEAVTHTARTLIGHWSDVVGKKNHPEMITLETIPLGVDCDRHRPATPEERKQVRARLEIPEDADVVLFVGRLSHHSKSNPLPMYAACQRAAEQTGRPVYLLLAGWYANEAIQDGFRSEAQRVAPDVRLLNINAMESSWRDSIWAAADLFVSLADSVQETFGLTVVEAMSRGLAVVASDWNGYRETIQHERTGMLVPTTMVNGAGERALLAMHEGLLSYDHFLAAVGQTVAVSTTAACQAIEGLLSSPERRKALAVAGHRHALENFAWPRIIARYERMWTEQHKLMSQRSSNATNFAMTTLREDTHAQIVPPLRDLFDQYPTHWVDQSSQLQTGGQLLGSLDQIEQSPLANHSDAWRFDSDTSKQLLNFIGLPEQQPPSIHGLRRCEILDDNQPENGDQTESMLDTIAWAVKFDLLDVSDRQSIDELKQTPSVTHQATNDITFATTCMGRLSHLQQSLPRMVAQPGCHTVLVDYSCPDQCGKWVQDNFSADQVTVVRVTGRKLFDRSEAKNAAISAATTPWVCLIDADIVVADAFAEQIRQLVFPQRFLRCMSVHEGVGGTFVASREALLQTGLHDPIFRDWGDEDADLLDALRFIGQQAGTYPKELVSHLPHDDSVRTRFHQTTDRRVSALINRIYRAAKWDAANIEGEIPNLSARREMYEQIERQVKNAVAARTSCEIVVPLGQKRWTQLSADGSRVLTYRVNIDSDF